MTESSHSIPLSELKTKKIFVIDDDLTQLTLISSILKKFGLEVTSFQNPAEALKKISTGAIPDIILTDIFMPSINGLELCRILKSELFPQTKETPILIISSQIMGEATMKIAKESGAYDFIELPTSPDVLLEKISSALLRDDQQEERLKILIIHSKDHPEPPWYRITDDPRYIPFVTTSIEEAIPLLEKEHFHIVLVSSKTEGDINKLFFLLNQHSYKKQTFTILMVPPESPQPFLSWVEQGLSGILTKPVSIENVFTLYEKLKTEQMLIRTKHILEEKIKQKLEEEIRWVTILHSMPVGIFIKDKSLNYIQVNKSYASLFNKDPIDFILNPGAEFFDEPHSNKFITYCQEALEGKIIQITRWETTILGKTYTFNIYLEPLKNPEGNITGIYGFLIDVTSETTLQENYRNLFEKMNEAFAEHEIVYDENGTAIDYKFLTVNPGFEKMTGLKIEEVIGKRVKEVIPDLEDFWLKTYWNVVYTGKPITFEHYAKSLNRYYLVHAYKTGTNRFACIFTDITQKKMFEEEIKKLNRQWQLTYDNLNSVIWFLNNDFEITKTNNAVIRILNLTPDEVLNKKCWEIIHGTPTPPDFCPAVRSLSTKKREFLEFKREDKWYEVVVDPVFDEQHNLAGAIHILSDITDRKKAEKEAQELQAQLFQSQKLESLGRLAGGIAHDLNNMLTAILGNIELAILKHETGEDIKDHLLEIRKAVDKTSEITNKILTFAKKQDSKPKLLNLNTEISQSLKILKKILPETITLEFHPSKNLWDIYIDPAHVDTIVLNLLVNARDAISGQGKISVKTENFVIDPSYISNNPDAKPGEYVKISISDTGHGIPPDILPHIFDPFFTTKRETGGSGLGLSVVYGAVKQNNGFIKVETELNKGTTFEIYLPRVQQSLSETITKKENFPEIENLIGIISTASEKKKVLIVDDEKNVTEILKNTIEKLGLEPLPVNSPSEALKIIEESRDNIILAIIDLILPEMNGVLLVEKIKELLPDIKVIIITGYLEEAVSDITKHLKDIEFVQKPFSIVTLSRKIAQLLG